MAQPWVPAEWQAVSGFGSWDSWDLNTRLRVWAGKYGSVSPDWQKVIVRDWVSSHYGAMAAYLDHPEIGPLLMNAATQGWDELTFNAALANTNWYKTHTGSQREWDLLTRTDPSSAQQKVDQLKQQITQLLQQEGVEGQFTDARITALATQLLRNGATAEMIPKAVIAEVQYAPTQPVGKLGDRMSQIGAAAESYLTPLSDATRFDWAKKIESGQATEEGFNEYLRQTAMAQYGANQTIADGIERGFSVKQLIDPQIQVASQLLEQDPEAIKFTPDSPWGQILNGGANGLMNLGEVQKFVKSSNEYLNTAGAGREVATLAQQIAKVTGHA